MEFFMKLNIFLLLLVVATSMQTTFGMELAKKKATMQGDTSTGNFFYLETQEVEDGVQVKAKKLKEEVLRMQKKIFGIINRSRSNGYSLQTKLLFGATCVAGLVGAYYAWRNPSVLSSIQGKIACGSNYIASQFSSKAPVVQSRYEAYLTKF